MDSAMPTLRQFRYLDALARAGHFGRAAGDCAVTQPALSMQIGELERELGVQLVERRRDGVTMTAEGTEVLRRARRALEEVGDLLRYAQSRKGTPERLALGVIPTVGPYLLPALLPALRASWPQTRIVVRESKTANLARELADDRLDVAIAALPVAGEGLCSVTLGEDRFLLATSLDRPRPPSPRRLLDYIASERLLLLEEGNCLRDQALRHCEAAGIRFGEVYGTSNIATLIELVAGGMGITLVPELSLRGRAGTPKVRLTRFPEPQPCRTLAAFWRASSPHAVHWQRVADLARPALARRIASRDLRR
jgi:LysR family hydrogen peroxide-inducible transcriptional activator